MLFARAATGATPLVGRWRADGPAYGHGERRHSLTTPPDNHPRSHAAACGKARVAEIRGALHARLAGDRTDVYNAARVELPKRRGAAGAHRVPAGSADAMRQFACEDSKE